jgi:hypothetical protein
MPETTSPPTSTSPGGPSSTTSAPAGASPTSPPPTPPPSSSAPPPAAPAAPTAASAPPAPPPRPEGVPEAFWDKDKGELRASDWARSYEELRSFKAEREALKAQVPAQPDLYKPDLPEGFTFPQGMELDTGSPVYKAARDYAHSEGWTQKQFTGALGIYLKDRAAEFTRYQEFLKAEDEALGENREARKVARDKFIEASAKSWFPANEAENVANVVKATPWNRHLFRFFEKAAEAVSRQGLKPYSAAGREPVEGRPDGLPDNWDKLDAMSRREWMLRNPNWRSSPNGGRAA